MSDQKIEFMEDPANFKPIQIEDKIEGKSIEAWVYKKLPGNIKLKKFLLIGFALLLFALSLYYALLAYMNANKEKIRQDFEEKVQNTQLN